MRWLDPTTAARVLVVMNLDPATPALLAAVRRRSWRGPAQFRVLVPNPAPAEWHPLDPERRDRVDDAERALLRAVARIQDTIGAPVRGHVSVRHDPMDAIEEMLADEPFDEIILAMPGPGLERRVSHLGLPVTAVR